MNRRRWIALFLVMAAAFYAGILAQRPHSSVGHLRRFATEDPGRPEHLSDFHGNHFTSWSFGISLDDHQQIPKLMTGEGWILQSSSVVRTRGTQYEFVCPTCYEHRASVTFHPSIYTDEEVAEFNRDCPLLEKIYLFLRTGHWRRPSDPTYE